MTETRTAVTEHGEVEYEVDECFSCGQEVAVSDANEGIVAENIEVDSVHANSDKKEYTITGVEAEGRLCNYCSGSPSTSDEEKVEEGSNGPISYAIGFLLYPYEPLRDGFLEYDFDEQDCENAAKLGAVAWMVFWVLFPWWLMFQIA